MSILAALLLATATPSAALDAAVTAIYRPYANDSEQRPVWDRVRFSAQTAALIAHWKRVMPEDELDGLNDADWFCLCQDYEGLRWAIVARRFETANRASATVRLTFPGATDRRQARLVFLREGGVWKLDDLFASDFPRGLKQALRETIAADERLRRP